MKNLIFLSSLAFIFLFSSCGKQDQKVETQNQSSTQNIAPNNETSVNQSADIKKWIGQYTFEESAKNVTGDGAQSWNYVIDIKAKDDNTLVAEIQVDGFQTMSRINADVKPSTKSAEFIFNSYGKDNMFELYKKGDRLFTFELNDKNEIITNWDKMKANVLDNQKGGKVMFKRIAS
ncbi:MAG: hypothetical protein IAE90_09115 [Ignavibacteria bacterium]|nr:hypothetical protein [Ignavibacteria bacterium]